MTPDHLEISELIIKGVATLNDANLNRVSAKRYGGTANGKAAVSWQKGLQLNGTKSPCSQYRGKYRTAGFP